jgi:hypothetical protein
MNMLFGFLSAVLLKLGSRVAFSHLLQHGAKATLSV